MNIEVAKTLICPFLSKGIIINCKSIGCMAWCEDECEVKYENYGEEEIKLESGHCRLINGE